jgi:hydrogenase maturation protease
VHLVRHAFPETEQSGGVDPITAARRKRTLIIGIGNSLRGDDAAGPSVARLLTSAPTAADVRIHEREGAALLEVWEGYDRVYLVDAVVSGAPPGTVHRFDVSEDPLPCAAFASLSHDFNVLEAVELARALDCLPGSLVVFGIEGAVFNHGAAMSPEVADAATAVARTISEEVSP